MARTPRIDYDQLAPFARWLVDRIEARGSSVPRVAAAVDMHPSQMHKIIKSYKPTYASYQRPGYEKAKAIGEYLGDLQGALVAAGYEDAASPAPIIREPDPDFEVIREAYEGGDDGDRNHMLSTAELIRAKRAQDAARRGAIGRIGNLDDSDG